MQLEPGFLQQLFRIFQRSLLGRGAENPCIHQCFQDLIQVIFKFVFLRDLSADPVQPQFVIDLFQKQVPSAVAVPDILFHLLVRMEPQNNLMILFFFFPGKLCGILPCPFIRVFRTGLLPDLLQIPKFLDDLGCMDPVLIDRLDHIEAFGVL